MTDKDYRAISDAIAQCWADYTASGGKSMETWEHHRDIVYSLANRFENDDPKFDHDRFIEACSPARVFQY